MQNVKELSVKEMEQTIGGGWIKCGLGTIGGGLTGAVGGAAVGTVTLPIIGSVSGTAVGLYGGAATGAATFC